CGRHTNQPSFPPRRSSDLGSYQDSIAKALTALKGGTPPQLAVLLSTDMFTLIDEDAIVPIDSLAKSEADKKWLGGFYDAFMQNRSEEHTSELQSREKLVCR